MTRATSMIEVKNYQPTTYDEPAEGPALVLLNIEEDLHGDFEGHGVATFLQMIRADGSASFIGLERVDATIAGRQGTFVVQNKGTVRGSAVSGTWAVVPHSGTGALAGLRGEGEFTAELGRSGQVSLDYWFE
jgi:hypothetical protein